MRSEQFTANAPGSFVLAIDDRDSQGLPRQTFLPHALYPDLILNPALNKLLEQVIKHLGGLNMVATVMPDPAILIRSFVRREAQLSSFIENTYANFDEVAAADAMDRRPRASAEAIETLNAELTIRQGVEAVVDRHLPVTNSLIRQLHQTLLDRDVKGHECRGRFREKQVYIGNELLGPDAARFVPPAWHLIPEAMEQFETAWRDTGPSFTLIRLACLHYQFETIHPFEDGNGRLGRVLILLGLCDSGLLTKPLLNASLYFERNRQAYYDGLLNVSTKGDWSGWIAFFLEALRVAAVESTDKLHELLDLQRQYHAAIRSARNSALLLTLIDQLFITPTITVSEAADVMGVTQPAAWQSVQKLMDRGILRVRKVGKPTIYVADRILKAVNAEPTRR